MKTIKRVATAPPFPSNATAAYGSTRPAETSSAGILLGKVGKAGFVSRARAARPMVVAQSHGIANQLRPPMM
jgi:hypothetical protein